MAKKCILWGEAAVLRIKDTSDFYCQECAEDNFADISILVKVEDEAQRLKAIVDEKLNNLDDDE